MKNILIKLLLAIIVFIMLFIVVKKTNASLFSKIDGNTNIDLAGFSIKLNGISITNSYSIDINDIIWQNANSNESVIAPGSIGKFNLLLDPSGTDVAIKYTISFIDHIIDNTKLLTVVSIKVNDTLVPLTDGKYSEILSLNDIGNNVTKNIEVTVSWINNEDNNESDSLIGVDQANAEFLDLNFNAIQYNG